MGIRSIFWKVLAGKSTENNWVESTHVPNFVPYTPAQLTKNFTATVADEISVTRGTAVKALYRDDQWIYVETADGSRGFIPQTYCKLQMDQNQNASKSAEKSRIKKPVIAKSDTSTLERKWERSNLQRFIDSLPVQKDEGEIFDTTQKCEATVIHDFKAIAPDDIDVHQNETVIVLNCTDADWSYVCAAATFDHAKPRTGFVPTSHLRLPPEKHLTPTPQWHQDENLLVVEPFVSRTPLDLTVRPGEWVRCTTRPVDEWIWVQRVTDEQQGFIPNTVVILATDL